MGDPFSSRSSDIPRSLPPRRTSTLSTITDVSKDTNTGVEPDVADTLGRLNLVGRDSPPGRSPPASQDPMGEHHCPRTLNFTPLIILDLETQQVFASWSSEQIPEPDASMKTHTVGKSEQMGYKQSEETIAEDDNIDGEADEDVNCECAIKVSIFIRRTSEVTRFLL